MEKKIIRLLLLLKVEFALFWILTVVWCVLYEMDILLQGSRVGDARAEYILQTVGILLAVCMIPLSLRMFSLSLVRRVRELSLPFRGSPLRKAWVADRRWCEIRLALLLAPVLFNLTVYYSTFNLTSLLCVGMLLVASLFCVPGRGRLMRELDLEKEKEEQ